MLHHFKVWKDTSKQAWRCGSKNNNDQKNNIVLDLPHPINDSEKAKPGRNVPPLPSYVLDIVDSYKSRLKKDVSLNICANCGKTPHDLKHPFAWPSHPTTLIPSDLWRRQIEYIREFGYLEVGNLD